MHASRERRYDGPLPRDAAVEFDADAPWSVQVMNRRRLAWVSVRRIGHEMVHESRMLRETHSTVHLERWRRLRGDLRYALDSWRTFREWSRPYEAGADIREAAE